MNRKFSAFLLFFALQTLNTSMVAANSNHFSAGEQAFAASDFSGAAKSFSSALKESPENLRARFRLGQALFSMKDYSESHKHFQAVLQNSPNNIIARVYLAENLIYLNRKDEARNHVEWILKVQPGHGRASELLAMTQSGYVAAAAPEKMPEDARPLAIAPVTPVSKASSESSGKKKARPAAKKTATVARPAPVSVEVTEFFAGTGNSMLVSIERSRYELENGDLKAAAEFLRTAEEAATRSTDRRRFIEIQVLKSLTFVYSLDFKGFGQHLMSLKPVLSTDSYQSFLDIYNQARELSDPADLARLSAGIAMGAGHTLVAARLFSEAAKKYPDDTLILNFLAEAHIQNFDYRSAESALSQLVRIDDKNAEAWFNLARFYLTAFYKPELASQYASYAASLRPDDRRSEVLLALIDYSQGRLESGIERMQKLLPALEDDALKSVCERIITDGSARDASTKSFASILALPGAPHATKGMFTVVGEDYLNRGSYLSALKYFTTAGDIAETGRAYLGFASALRSGGEKASADLAAEFGVRALEIAMQKPETRSRAHLYKAIYHFDLGDRVTARAEIEKGLAGECEPETRRRLTAILNGIIRS